MAAPTLVSIATLVIACAVVACGSSSPRGGFDDTSGADAGPAPSPTTAPTGDFDHDASVVPPTTPSGEVDVVYGQSADVLFELDPTTSVVTQIGSFDGCSSVIDIALDQASTLYAATYTGLYTVDKTTAKCTQIATGNYPNSLSFVPAGTLDPTVEALVGYVGSDYVRIDTKTGATTTIGSLGGGLTSSGDIVSVKGGKSYLTVKGGTCTSNDCLVEVDPTTGALVKNWGSVEHHNVFGLSFWGGSVYGFDDTGHVFKVTFGTSTITTTSISIPSAPSGLSFWGAGSSTSAPLVPTTK